MAGQHAVVEHTVGPRWRHECRQALEQLVGGEHDAGGAVAPRALEADQDVSGVRELQALLAQGRTSQISADPLESSTVESSDDDASMHVEAVDRRTSRGKRDVSPPQPLDPASPASSRGPVGSGLRRHAQDRSDEVLRQEGLLQVRSEANGLVILIVCIGVVATAGNRAH